MMEEASGVVANVARSGIDLNDSNLDYHFSALDDLDF